MSRSRPISSAFPRLRRSRWPSAVYAVGDVHGCFDALTTLERIILEDAGGRPGGKLLVMLGDYIDRGPQSRQVIDHLLEPAPAGFERICLRGNHEQMMLDYLADPQSHGYWLDEGGAETLASYGIAAEPGQAGHGPASVATQLPQHHLAFLAGLPGLLQLPGWIFVHAGIRPGVPLERQRDDDLIWIREPFLEGGGLPGFRVVHGHTPVDAPEVTPPRIGIDTHCYATGRLTALRVTPDGDIGFLTAEVE